MRLILAVACAALALCGGASIRRADLSHRRIILIRNPFLPKETPLEDRRL